ncbi:hypothetical protein GCM10012275_10220 [Longimycelium tulufanense]|uniref:Uncharacterized protein n=1 Tax=Longimycelium tulufanense TaxID=907463 RepID=A0A8J3C6J9_9PSEU|nr:hypothetical protein GCM10012275_10220 [Longimycelium tulufanense]
MHFKGTLRDFGRHRGDTDLLLELVTTTGTTNVAFARREDGRSWPFAQNVPYTGTVKEGWTYVCGPVSGRYTCGPQIRFVP